MAACRRFPSAVGRSSPSSWRGSPRVPPWSALWDCHGNLLLELFDCRWLISASHSFVDIHPDPAQAAPPRLCRSLAGRPRGCPAAATQRRFPWPAAPLRPSRGRAPPRRLGPWRIRPGRTGWCAIRPSVDGAARASRRSWIAWRCWLLGRAARWKAEETWITLPVRDAADVLRLNLEHHIAQGLGVFVVTDSGSRESTGTIAAALRRPWTRRVDR